MTPDLFWKDDPFPLDVAFGYLARNESAPQRHNPRLVLNGSDGTVLHSILEELKSCHTFTFSVAFISPEAIALMIQDLLDFRGTGRIITSDYLAFNSPAAFAEALKLRDFNIDVRLHNAKAFHPKGYVFEHDGFVTSMVGSSNLTKYALASNHEWNLKVSAADGSDLATQFSDLVTNELQNSDPLTQDWLDAYAAHWVPSPPTRAKAREFPDPEGPVEHAAIQPNGMQLEALKALAEMRGVKHADRALVISATGTGKTILSALDVRAAAPRRLLFVVHREQILDRTIEAFHAVLGGPLTDYGKLTGTAKQTGCRYVFATVQTLSKKEVLAEFNASAFDYVIIDEAHRSGATSYQRVLDHFKPPFLLGMTATPERGDGKSIYEIFDFNVAYEIRLNHALEADMLSPFHYYGVADVVYDEPLEPATKPDDDVLKVLITPERVDHVVNAIRKYGQAGVQPRGLIFCSRKSEAHALSAALNERTLRGPRLRTIALTGDDSVEAREVAVRRLESGEIDYILTVDVFNEGVDIPTVNQIIMLRPTQSAIVFVQQLGRGLRKAPHKNYVVVIDFIGNYVNNYMIPIALFGDESLNKESLRKNLISAEESGILPGLSSVRFDRIAQERVLKAISVAKLDSIVVLKASISAMQERVGTTPSLWDFYRFESADPVLLATKMLNYPELAAKVLKTSHGLSERELQMLGLLSHEVLTAKRLHEFVIVRQLLDEGPATLHDLSMHLLESGVTATEDQVHSAVDTLTLERHSEVDQTRYGNGVASVASDGAVDLIEDFRRSYRESDEFRDAVDDLLRTGAHVVVDRYSGGDPFVQGAQYSRKEVTRLLGFPRKWTSTLYGYKADPVRMVCPLFVTLHKSNEVSASTAYEDAILDRSTMVWYTKSNKTLESPVEKAIAEGKYQLPVFVKKDDAEGSESYFLGFATPSSAEETGMAGKDGENIPVVRMLLHFDAPMDLGLYNYFHPTLTV